MELLEVWEPYVFRRMISSSNKKDDTAMESSLLPVVCNISMENFKK
jgi:hypothetical protein